MADRTTIPTPGPREPRYWVIAADAEATGRHVRQTSCPGHFALVTLKLEIDFGPDAVFFVSGLDEDSPVWFVDMQEPPGATRSLGTDCWAPFVADVVQGVREALARLSPAGSPIQGLKVSLTSMKVHRVDSRVGDFKQAAILAMTEAVRKAGLVEGPS